MSNQFKNKGFTLLELLVVVSIIGLLASVIMTSLNTAREKARDSRRFSDMRQIQIALELYYDKYGVYPGNNDNDYGGYDTGCYGVNDPFIAPLLAEGFITQTVCDPFFNLQSGGYEYYRYAAGVASCDTARGAFYVLGIRNLESISGTHPSSPGWSCPGQNWQSQFEWVTGKFER